MLKPVSVAFLFFFGVLRLLSQEVDSTEIKLQAYQFQDTVKVEMLVDACVNSTFKSDERILKWATEAQEISEKLDYPLGKIRSANCLGNYYYQIGLYDRSMEYYMTALRLAEAKKDLKNTVIGKSNVGNVLTHMNKPKEGIRVFKECDVLLQTSPDSISQYRAAILVNLATAYSVGKMHDSAIYYYQRVYQISDRLGLAFGKAISTTNLGSEYFYTQQYDEALDVLKEADELTTSLGLKSLSVDVDKIYGRIFLARGNTSKAIEYLNKGLEDAVATNHMRAIAEITRTLHTAYASINDYENAYRMLTDYVAVADSLWNIDKDKTVSELNTQYETEKKELQIESLTQEKTIVELKSEQKTLVIFVIGAISLLVLGVGLFLFTRYRYKKENQALAARADYEKGLNRSVLTSIKAQMNPHFFYNALNTIQAYIFSDDKRNAITYLNKFSNLTRMILEMSEKELVPLSQEVKALTLYLELEKSRFQNNFNYEFEVDQAIDQEMVSIPAMLIQPYVENSIKHGLLHKSEDRQLKLEISRSGNLLSVTIDDNGVGREQSAKINSQRPDKPKSFSTNANQMRLELLNNGRSNKVGVKYIDKQDDRGSLGTTVIITIPLQSDEY